MDIFATKIGKQDNNADFLYFDESDTALYLKLLSYILLILMFFDLDMSLNCPIQKEGSKVCGNSVCGNSKRKNQKGELPLSCD
jgi:hypothetical protein